MPRVCYQTPAREEPIVITLAAGWKVKAIKYGDGKCQIAVLKDGKTMKVESVFGKDTYVAAHGGVCWAEKHPDFIALKSFKKCLTENGSRV